MFRYLVIVLIVISVLQVNVQAQTKLNVSAPEMQIVASLATSDTLTLINASYNFVDTSDAESKFKEARYMLQKDDMYVAYNKDKEVVEIGLFACY